MKSHMLGVFLLGLLTACVTNPPAKPSEDNGVSRKSKSASDQRMASPDSSAVSDTQTVRFDDPFFSNNPDISVDAKCRQLAKSKSSYGQLVYVAGDCDSDAKANGIGVVSDRNVFAEGLFRDGQYIRGMKYRIYIINDNRLLGGRMACTEMTPDNGEFFGSDRTVCKEFVTRNAGRSPVRSRILSASSDRSIRVSDRYLTIEKPTRCKGSYFSAIRQYGKPEIRRDIDGICDEVPNDHRGESYSVKGDIFVKLNNDTFKEIGGLWLLISNNGGDHKKIVAPSSDNIKNETFTSNDGTQFTPLTRDGYKVIIFKKNMDEFKLASANRNKAFATLQFGETVFVIPISGKIKYPDGRVYEGSFLDGNPLFK